MKHSILYKALAGIHGVLENYDEGEIGAEGLNNLGFAIITLNQLTGNQVVKESTESEPTELTDDSDEFGEVDGPSNDLNENIEGDLDDLDELDENEPEDDSKVDALLEDAYNLLKDESKPGPTLLRNKLRIGAKRASELVTTLVDQGRIKKHSRKKPVKKDKPLGELIAELPAGSDLIVHSWLQPLIYLDPERRSLYTNGLGDTVKDMLTAKDIKRATKNGADTVLIDAFISGADSDVIEVDTIATTEKVQGFINKANTILSDEGKLFDFIVRNGMNGDTVRDLVTMARGVKGNS